MLFLQLGQLGGDAFQLGRELVDGLLLLGEVARDDERLGHEVAGPAFVLLLALLVLLDDAVGLGLPAVGGDEIAVVLHRLRPVVQEVLIDVVFVDERLVGVVGQQILGKSGDDFLRMTTDLQLPQRLGALLPPSGEMLVHAGDEGGKLRVFVDRGLDRRLVHGEIEIAGAVVLEQARCAASGKRPNSVAARQHRQRDAAVQMAVDVLNVLGLLAVDVAREIEIEIVLLDLLDGDHARVFRDFELPGEDIDDLVDVLGAQAVLGAVLHEAGAGVDHEDALAGVGVLLVDDDDAGGDAGAVKQVGGQADDALDVALADEIAANVGLGIAAKQNAVRQNAGAFAGALERADDVQQIGVVALLGRRRAEGLEALVVDRAADRGRCSSACR